MVRAVRGCMGRVPGQFQAPVLGCPLPGSWTVRRRNPACRHRPDPVRRMALAKYAPLFAEAAA